MAHKECCRTCVHSSSVKPGIGLWCRLRQINVHADLATFAFCHHWSRSSPLLPEINGAENKLDKQLEFAPVISSR